MIRYIVKQFVVENFAVGDGSDFHSDTSFIEEAVVNSIDRLELIMFLEETFDIDIEDQEAMPENLGSLDKIAQFVELKRCMCVI